MARPEEDISVNVIGNHVLPRNIQHMFGTKVCQHLMSDKEKVAKTKEYLKPSKEYKSYDSSKDKQNPAKMDNYNMIGSIMRSNILPGAAVEQKPSLAKESYTWKAWDERKPDPDGFRYHRDHFTHWNEEVVIHDRMLKAWEEARAEKMKTS